MKKYFFLLAMMAISVCLFCGCSSSGDDDNIPEGYVQTTEGVHRIEVSFDGDTDGFKANLLFIAVYGDGSHGKVNLYENGKQVGIGSYQAEELRSYAVETDARCDQMNVAISTSRDSKETGKSMTVTLKSYINGKPIKSKTATFSTDEYYKSIIFDSELDADIL